MLKKKTAALVATIMAVTAFGTTAYAASDVLTVDEVRGNLISNGTFENDTTGWAIDPGVSIKRIITDTHDDSAGAALVSQKTTARAKAEFSARNNQYYRIQAYVKLQEGEPNVRATIVAEGNNGAFSAVTETKAVNADSWTLLEGYFINIVDGASSISESTAVCYVDISADANFYLDDVLITSVEPDITMATVADADIENEEYLTQLINDGIFPDVDKAVNANGKTDAVYAAIDGNTEYVISAWYKVKGGTSGDEVVLTGTPLNTAGSEPTQYILAKDAVSNSEWHRINVSYTHTSNARNNGDMKLELSCEGKEILVSELKVTKASLIKHSSFVYATSAAEGNNIGSAENTPDYQLSGWSVTGASGEILVNPTFTTYDRSNVVGKLTATSDAIKVGQESITIPKGTAYEVGAWVMLDDSTTATAPKANMSYKITSRGRETDGTMYNLTPGEWTWIPVGDSYISANVTTKHGNGLVYLNVTGLNNNDKVYFGGMMLNNIMPEASGATVTDVTLPSLSEGSAIEPICNADAEALVYKYMVSDSETGPWTVVESGHTLTGDTDIPSVYADLTYAGKYVKVYVIPMNINGEYGTAITSNVELAVKKVTVGTPTSSPNISVPGLIDTTVNVANNTGASMDVTVWVSYYNSRDERIAVGIGTVTIDQDDNEDVVVGVTPPTAEGVYSKVYILRGNVIDGGILPLYPLSSTN